MIYHEKTDVKQYKRKTSKGFKSFNQLNLGYESEFEKGEEVAIVKLSDFNELVKKLELLEELQVDKDKMIKELESLKSDNQEYSKRVLELSQSLENADNELKKELDLRSKLIFSYERVISDIQDKWLYKLFGLKLPESYKLLDEFKEEGKEDKK